MTEQTNRIINLLSNLKRKYKTIDPFEIADQIGVEVRYVDFPTNPLGQYISIAGTPMILLSSKIENTNARYFVAAHELHHAIEYGDFSSNYTQNSKNRSKVEYEANAFAATVCINLFVEEFGVEDMTTQDLENHFGLPMELSEILLLN